MSAKAYLFTHVQSGDVVADTDPDFSRGQREMWWREPLYPASDISKAVKRIAIANKRYNCGLVVVFFVGLAIGLLVGVNLK